MRIHPISLALRYLKGHRTIRAAPYYGAQLFNCDDEAVAALRRLTGQDFGSDATAWGTWLRRNRWVYHASPDDSRHATTSTKKAPTAMKKKQVLKKESGDSFSQEFLATIEELNDWRGDTLARVRKLIKQADPKIVEEMKWRKPSNAMLGVPVWSHGGIICTGETYKSVVKLTFAKGASLPDPAGLFNASLEGNTRRAIDIREGEKLDENAFTALVRAAMALNTATAGKKPKAV